MNVGELMDVLRSLDPEIEVRIAHQPQWAFEYHVGTAALLDLPEKIVDHAAYEAMGEDEALELDAQCEAGNALLLGPGEDMPKPIVYLSEGSFIGYLPGRAAQAVGWGRD